MDCINHDKPLKNLDILFKKLIMIIDSHCHLTYEPMVSALEETINRANNDNGAILFNSTEDKSFGKI